MGFFSQNFSSQKYFVAQKKKKNWIQFLTQKCFSQKGLIVGGRWLTMIGWCYLPYIMLKLPTTTKMATRSKSSQSIAISNNTLLIWISAKLVIPKTCLWAYTRCRQTGQLGCSNLATTICMEFPMVKGSKYHVRHYCGDMHADIIVVSKMISLCAF